MKALFSHPTANKSHKYWPSIDHLKLGIMALNRLWARGTTQWICHLTRRDLHQGIRNFRVYQFHCPRQVISGEAIPWVPLSMAIASTTKRKKSSRFNDCRPCLNKKMKRCLNCSSCTTEDWCKRNKSLSLLIRVNLWDRTRIYLVGKVRKRTICRLIKARHHLSWKRLDKAGSQTKMQWQSKWIHHWSQSW